MLLGLSGVLGLLRPVPVLAHADLLLQIEEATKSVNASPKDPELYIRRGELRRAHLEWDEAFADFERASALNPDLWVLDLVRGRLFVEAGWPLSARAYLDRLIQRQPKHSEGYLLRARALSRLHLRLAAADDFDRAVSNAAEPTPDLFVERAQELVDEGSEQYARALQGIEEGIRRMGPLVTLQLFAIDLQVKTRNFDGALARVDQVAARSPRKETWLMRKGEILRQAGRPAEAREVFQSALAALQTLPPTRRNVPAMQELEKRLRGEIDGTSTKPLAEPKSN